MLCSRLYHFILFFNCNSQLSYFSISTERIFICRLYIYICVWSLYVWHIKKFSDYYFLNHSLYISKSFIVFHFASDILSHTHIHNSCTSLLKRAHRCPIPWVTPCLTMPTYRLKTNLFILPIFPECLMNTLPELRCWQRLKHP